MTCHWSCTGAATATGGNVCDDGLDEAAYCKTCDLSGTYMDKVNAGDGYGTCTSCAIDYCLKCTGTDPATDCTKWEFGHYNQYNTYAENYNSASLAYYEYSSYYDGRACLDPNDSGTCTPYAYIENCATYTTSGACQICLTGYGLHGTTDTCTICATGLGCTACDAALQSPSGYDKCTLCPVPGDAPGYGDACNGACSSLTGCSKCLKVDAAYVCTMCKFGYRFAAVGTCTAATTDATPDVTCHWSCNGAVDTVSGDSAQCRYDDGSAAGCTECTLPGTYLVPATTGADYGTCTSCGIDYCILCDGTNARSDC